MKTKDFILDFSKDKENGPYAKEGTIDDWNYYMLDSGLNDLPPAAHPNLNCSGRIILIVVFIFTSLCTYAYQRIQSAKNPLTHSMRARSPRMASGLTDCS